jgi:hypothetical protein
MERIVYSDSYFENISPKKWKEVNENGIVYWFDEKCDTEEYLELSDESRMLMVKIYRKNLDLWVCSVGNLWYLAKTRGVRSKINVGSKKIAIVTLGTPNMKRMLRHSRRNQEFYAKKHGYTYIAYENSFLPFEIVTWNKVFVLERHLKEYDVVMWIDSDAIFTNMKGTIESIVKMNTKDILLCDDIGGWTVNTGVMIWKNTKWSRSILKDWQKMKKLPHSQGAEQQQLIHLLSNEDKHCIFPRKLFNQHPKEYVEGDYILHMMGYSEGDRIQRFILENNRIIATV